MSTDPIARALDRVQQGRVARERELAAAAGSASAAAAAAAPTHQPGARVFDVVTGQFVEVVHAARENVIVSTPDR